MKSSRTGAAFVLTSKITEYDSQWAFLFEVAAKTLKPVFAGSLIQFHHVGSTAVPGLAAKPEIDMLAVVRSGAVDTDWSNQLPVFGYRRGKDLSVGHQFYKRDERGRRTHKLHVCIDGHRQIDWMLSFRDLLLRDTNIRSDYEALKKQLEGSNTLGIAEYLAQKDPFIRAAMRHSKSG